MQLLTRYILCELLKVFCLSLLVLTTVMMLFVVTKAAVREGLGLIPVLKLIPYALPYSLRFTVPGTMLFAACSVFGRMSADNEVVAIRASGASPMRVLKPALILALVISPVALWVNDLAVSWGRIGIYRVVLHSVEQIAYGMLRTKRLYTTEYLSITVQRVDGRKLVRPIISVRGGDKPITFSAQEAELKLDADRDVLNVSLVNCEIDVGSDYHATLDQITQPIPLSAASRQSQMSDRPADLPLGRIPRERQGQRARIAQIEYEMAAHAAFQMLSGDLDGLGEDDDQPWSGRLARLQGERCRFSQLQTEPWRRFATGFSCFFFVLAGAPLAIRLRNADFLTTFFLCFIPILLLYYPLFMLGVERAKAGGLPPYAVWLGNVALGAVGLWMVRKLIRK